jgi:hypothetical protein
MVGLDVIPDGQHRRILDRAIRNVLGTDLAMETYSQIIDGLPLSSVAFDIYGPGLASSHPIARHTSLCPGVMEIAREFLSESAVGKLDFDSKVSP